MKRIGEIAILIYSEKSMIQIARKKKNEIITIIISIFLSYLAFAISMQSTTNIWYNGDCSGDFSVYGVCGF